MEDKYKYIFILFISMCILNFLVIPVSIYPIHSENITTPLPSARPCNGSQEAAAPRLNNTDGPPPRPLDHFVAHCSAVDCRAAALRVDCYQDCESAASLTGGLRRSRPTGGGSCSEFISKIIDGLYLGDIRCASNLKFLKLHKIKYILNVTDDIPFFFKNNFEYARIPIKDKPDVDVSVFFNHSSSYIENRIRDGNIFIHCYAGISRSSSIVIAYLIIKKKYSYKDAYNLVKSKRPCIRPNKGFDYLLRRLAVTSEGGG